MARAATKWAYGPKVLALKLAPAELAVLRALCWKMREKPGRTEPLTGGDLTRLTAIRSPQTLSDARRRLRDLGLIAYEHANKLPRRDGEAAETSIAYVYSVRYREVR